MRCRSLIISLILLGVALPAVAACNDSSMIASGKALAENLFQDSVRSFAKKRSDIQEGW